MNAFASFVSGRRTKWIMLGFWLLVLVAIAPVSSKLESVEKNEASSYLHVPYSTLRYWLNATYLLMLRLQGACIWGSPKHLCAVALKIVAITIYFSSIRYRFPRVNRCARPVLVLIAYTSAL